MEPTGVERHRRSCTLTFREKARQSECSTHAFSQRVSSSGK